MVFKELKHKKITNNIRTLDVINADFTNHSYWEEVPDEDLYQDGELSGADLLEEIYQKVIIEGNWKLIRRKDD